MPGMLFMPAHNYVCDQVNVRVRACVCECVLFPVGMTIQQIGKCVTPSDSKTFASRQENSKLPT